MNYWVLSVMMLTSCRVPDGAPGVVELPEENGSSSTTRVDDANASCPCGYPPTRYILRGIVATRTPLLHIEILAIFNPPGTVDGNLIAVNDIIGGTYDGVLPCSEDAFEPQADQELLVFYARSDLDHYPGCAEYRTCSAEQCGPSPFADEATSDEERALWDRCDEDCILNTREACGTHRQEALFSGVLSLTAWDTEELWFGNDAMLDPDDLYTFAEGLATCPDLIQNRQEGS